MKKNGYTVLGIILLVSCTNHHASDTGIPKSFESNDSELRNRNSITYFNRDLKILISDSFHDTTLIFRSSALNDTSLWTIADTNQINYRIEKILLQSKYLPDFHLKGYYTFITCLKTHDNIKEIGFFYVNRDSKAIEMRRFRIENNIINGLICLPGVVKEFMSTEKYDSLERIPFEL